MKKKVSRLLSFVVALIVITAIFTGCSGDSGSKQAIGDAVSNSDDFLSDSLGGIKNDYEIAEDAEMPESGSDIETDSGEFDSSRKIIETIDMKIETKEFTELMNMIETQTDKFNGYIANSRVDGNSYSGSTNRDAWLVIRIPAEKSDEFIEFVSGNSVVTQKIVDTEDVTLEYVDVESRLKALELERAALEELLEQASTVDEIIYVQESLSDVIYRIESVNSQLRSYDNQIAYTTITLNIYEVETPTVVHEQTVWEEIATKFDENIKEIKEDIIDIFVYIISESPYLLLYAIGIFVIVAIASRITKKQKNLKATADAQEQVQSEESDIIADSTEAEADVSSDSASE